LWAYLEGQICAAERISIHASNFSLCRRVSPSSKPLPPSQELLKLRDFVGASGHVAHKILCELKDAGVVDTSYRTIRILNEPTLEAARLPRA
jgi:hypothetical protein